MNSIMKRYQIKIVFFALLLVVCACGKDNYDAPSSQLTGSVVYNGEPVGVRGSNQSVYLQLWQEGYPVKTAINVYVSQDGSFSARLFDGTYKLVSTSGNGPWQSKQDTVVVKVNGNTTADYPVVPYFRISNISYALNGNLLTASFDVTAIDNTKTIEYVSLLVNDTKFVDFGQKVNSAQTDNPAVGHIQLSLDVSSALASHNALFARIGLKVTGVTEGIYDTGVKQIK